MYNIILLPNCQLHILNLFGNYTSVTSKHTSDIDITEIINFFTVHKELNTLNIVKLKSADSDGFIAGTVDREKTFMIQTPQVFYLDKILDMHQKALDENFVATDDCMIAEHYGVKIKISDGSYDNIKLTTPEDMIIGERILRKRGITE